MLGGSKKGLSLTSYENSFLSQNFEKKGSLKMLTWSDLDHIDHFAWGITNKKPRTSAMEVSPETFDALLMFCGEEVGSISYNFNCKTSLKQLRNENQYNFYCCTESKPTLKGSTRSPCWMCLPSGKYEGTSTGSSWHV